VRGFKGKCQVEYPFDFLCFQMIDDDLVAVWSACYLVSEEKFAIMEYFRFHRATIFRSLGGDGSWHHRTIL
jgi:hypothetical protein